MSENTQFPQGSLQDRNIPPEPSGQPKFKTLTNLMITNISVLAIVGIASILVMLFGDFDGKGIRVASTFLVFAAFTAFTAMDSSDKKPTWYLPIGQIGNIYMLGLSLIQIWATLGGDERDRYYDEAEIFFNTFMIIIVVKLGTMIVQKISDLIYLDRPHLPLASKIAALSFAAATVLFTLPAGLDWISFFSFDEGYWRFSTAVILLAGLSLAITVLLAWFYGVLPQKSSIGTFGGPTKAPQSAPVQQVNNTPQPATESKAPVPSLNKPVAPQRSNIGGQNAPEFAPPVKSALTWPVFPSGLPLPAKPNGRPDFGALREIARIYDEAENQWFGH